MVYQKVAVESSNIEAIAHDSIHTRLLVFFKNKTVYAYAGVPKEKYDAMLAAESKGKFFAAEIKEAFPASQVLVPDQNPLMLSFDKESIAAIANTFTTHQVDDLQKTCMANVRNNCMTLAAIIYANSPDCDQRREAINHLQTVMMKANMAIAMYPKYEVKNKAPEVAPEAPVAAPVVEAPKKSKKKKEEESVKA